MSGNEDLNSAIEDVMEELKRRELSQREEEYRVWCDGFASVPDDFMLVLKDGLIAHVELQPARWIQHGLDLIGSRKGVGAIQLSSGVQGADLRAYLPYPVFQMGAEMFLKGMWLCQYDDLRRIRYDTYISPETRLNYLKRLKGISPKRHDLLGIIGKIEQVPVYASNSAIVRFLKVVGGISKQFYHPLAAGETSWADERYPKRFYNDSTKVGRADEHKSYPEHWLVSRLFEEAAERIESIWEATVD